MDPLTLGYWLFWLLVVFLPFELFAAVTHRKYRGAEVRDTFSEFVWWAFGIKHPKPYGPLRRFVLSGFMVSLTAHFVLGTGPLGVIVFGVGVAAVVGYAVAFERGTK